eukprot:CAMPEP_0185790902 /NCGR_PEP_ID=MMETSP1174-20130828/158069_1 /TAXON_ID=35687 /ORGANISM="Dictyocha speculum, Strain CCMP1381" /LENGTH=281 /DNA_ID=CAMNT_0028485773 /DNA_START=40 /DNA_END=886 /DNA_ORIENTATION=-
MSHAAVLFILTLGLHATSAFQAPVRLSTGCRPAELKSIKLITEKSAKKAGASNGEIFMNIGILPGSAGNPISASNAYGVGSTNAFGISNGGYGGDIVSTGYTPYGATGYTPYGNYLNDYGYGGIGRNWADRYEGMGGYGGYGRSRMMGGYGGYGRNRMMGGYGGYGRSRMMGNDTDTGETAGYGRNRMMGGYGGYGIGRNWADRYEGYGNGYGYGGYGRNRMMGEYGGYGRSRMMGNRYGYGGNGFGYDGYGYDNYDRRGRHHRMGRGMMNWYNGGRARYY